MFLLSRCVCLLVSIIYCYDNHPPLSYEEVGNRSFTFLVSQFRNTFRYILNYICGLLDLLPHCSRLSSLGSRISLLLFDLIVDTTYMQSLSSPELQFPQTRLHLVAGILDAWFFTHNSARLYPPMERILPSTLHTNPSTICFDTIDGYERLRREWHGAVDPRECKRSQWQKLLSVKSNKMPARVRIKSTTACQVER